MHVIGIDPGATGAVTTMYISGNKVKAMNTFDMPYDKKTKNVDVNELFLWLMKNSFGTIKDDTLVIMEYTKSRPSEGVVSAFTYGYLTGQAKAAAELLKLHAEELGVDCNVFVVSPKVWQSHTVPNLSPGLEKKEKKYNHYLRIEELYPKYKDKMFGTKGGLKDGRVDSVLIAEFGRLLVSTDIKNKVSKGLKDQLLEAEHAGVQTKEMLKELSKRVVSTQNYLANRKERRKVIGSQLSRDRKNLTKLKATLERITERWYKYYGDA